MAAIQESPNRGIQILVADDEPAVRGLFAKQLRSAGYCVSEAESGLEALRLLREISFQLLVLDLEMPEIDGFEVLKIVRAEFPGLQVLVISGYLEGVLLKAAECFGAVLTLEKTSAPRFLVEAARKLLGSAT